MVGRSFCSSSNVSDLFPNKRFQLLTQKQKLTSSPLPNNNGLSPLNGIANDSESQETPRRKTGTPRRKTGSVEAQPWQDPAMVSPSSRKSSDLIISTISLPRPLLCRSPTYTLPASRVCLSMHAANSSNYP